LSRQQRLASTQTQKREGSIADAFVSLSEQQFKPIDQKYADIKGRLIKGREDAITTSWERLLKHIRTQLPVITALGSNMIPQIDFADLSRAPSSFQESYKSTGVAVIRNVIPEAEALEYKSQLRDYIGKNPSTKAFPQDNPQVFELYWSAPQLRARAHPNMLSAQRFLMSFWNTDRNPSAAISTKHPISYADRLRMRQPGDAKFALGPHVDGGSVERWEELGYGRGGVYDAIWAGRWENFDPWEASCRLPVISDMYAGVGACSMFRMAQGWLSLSHTGANEGTLLVNPLLKAATAYYLLRPFFTPRRQQNQQQSLAAFENNQDDYLHPDNWVLESPASSYMHGANPGNGQELSPLPHMHPHLDLAKSMLHVPTVRPGDYVAWHCDTIHAVDRVHRGKADSSVMYIPACPLTEANARYLARQRDCFVKGIPSPDFGGGIGESKHVGRVKADELEGLVGLEGARAMGLEMWNSEAEGLRRGEKEVLDRANTVLGFY
jgi:hypothetical protein